ncbi:hypothetical protein BH23GEM10_BH23GEM10_17080 [soil metagenome]
MSDAAAAARVERVVCGVVEAALAASGAHGLLVLEDRSPEGELVHGWLQRAFGDTAHRVTVLASNVQGMEPAAAHRLVADREYGRMLIVHRVNRTMLLRGGAPPRADLLPLGDVHASWLERLHGACTLSADVQAAADAVGGLDRLDAVLAAWIDARADSAAAVVGLDPAAAARLTELYERGRFYRLWPRLVPKLGARTLGIDLWD